jgi:hypothetical protein
MRRSLLAAAAAVSLAFGVVGAANATIATYNFNVLDSASGLGAGPFGTLTVEDSVGSSNALIQNADQLLFTVDLNDPTYNFRTATGNNQFADILAFNLTGATGVTGSILSPVGGNAGGSNALTFSTAGGFQSGWTPTFQYSVLSHDSDPPPNFFAGPLVLRIQATNALTVSSLSGNTVTSLPGGPFNVFAATDLINTTNANTGPVGATLSTITTVTGGIPEPASWALMIMGFGGIGASLRARRRVAAAATA